MRSDTKGMADARFRIMLASVQSLEEGEYSISANAELARLRSSAARGGPDPGRGAFRGPSAGHRAILQDDQGPEVGNRSVPDSRIGI